MRVKVTRYETVTPLSPRVATSTTPFVMGASTFHPDLENGTRNSSRCACRSVGARSRSSARSIPRITSSGLRPGSSIAPEREFGNATVCRSHETRSRATQAPHGLEAFEGVWVGTEQSRCSYTDRYTTGAGVEKGTPKYDCAEGSGSTGPLMVRVFVGGGLVPADLATWDGDLAGDGPWVWHRLDRLVRQLDGWHLGLDLQVGLVAGLRQRAHLRRLHSARGDGHVLGHSARVDGAVRGLGPVARPARADEEGRMSTKVEHRWDPEGLSEGKAAFKMTGLVKQAAP